MDNLELKDVLYTTQLPREKIIKKVGNSSYILIPAYVFKLSNVMGGKSESLKITMLLDTKNSKEKFIIILEEPEYEL